MSEYVKTDDTVYFTDSEIQVWTLRDERIIVQSCKGRDYPVPSGWEIMGVVHRTDKAYRGVVRWNRWNGVVGKNPQWWESIRDDQPATSKRARDAKSRLTENGNVKILIYKHIAHEVK